eukprot:271865-Prymnesium_polylepis.1
MHSATLTLDASHMCARPSICVPSLQLPRVVLPSRSCSVIQEAHAAWAGTSYALAPSAHVRVETAKRMPRYDVPEFGSERGGPLHSRSRDLIVREILHHVVALPPIVYGPHPVSSLAVVPVRCLRA